jgi:hypothetical protein
MDFHQIFKFGINYANLNISQLKINSSTTAGPKVAQSLALLA